MLTVQIEHAIRDYDGWKAAFDRDPARREASGVRSYRVYRPVADPQYVIIELDFGDLEAAEAFVLAMRAIWAQVQGTLIAGPQVRIVDCVEQHEY
ncbi:MAG: hypothetical protein ABIT20_23110 [Gemmatimonadaceae bacterium]